MGSKHSGKREKITKAQGNFSIKIQQKPTFGKWNEMPNKILKEILERAASVFFFNRYFNEF